MGRLFLARDIEMARTALRARDRKQAQVRKWIDPKKVPGPVGGLWGTFGGLILKERTS